MADGRADNHPEEIGQAGGTAGIHGMTLCKTEKFSDGFPDGKKCPVLSLQSHAAHHKRVRNGCRHAFPSRKRVPETASYKGGIRCFNHRHYDGHPAAPGSQKSRIHGAIRLIKILGENSMALKYTQEQLNSLDRETLTKLFLSQQRETHRRSRKALPAESQRKSRANGKKTFPGFR